MYVYRTWNRCQGKQAGVGTDLYSKHYAYFLNVWIITFPFPLERWNASTIRNVNKYRPKYMGDICAFKNIDRFERINGQTYIDYMPVFLS